MAGRFPDTQVLQKCLSPVTVFHHGEKYVVPCGKCAACRLSRSNDWTFRVEDEIEAAPYTIFFTLTYSNKYIPKLHMRYLNGVYWFERDAFDVRFNGVEDVLREDDMPSDGFVNARSWPVIQNFYSTEYFGYSSKRDIQLWLKSLRKDIFDNFCNQDKQLYERNKIRYFIISEYGPNTFRPHVHGLIFVQSAGLADYLVQTALYQNWQMCDKTLFDNYTKFASKGVSNYLASYLTNFNRLPRVLSFDEFKPWRLSSKNPAIGYASYDSEEIYEKISSGTIEYVKSVTYADAINVFCYPSNYLRSLFPRCFEFRVLPYYRLLQVYGQLFTAVVRQGKSYDDVSKRLRENLRPIDYLCARKCYQFCVSHSNSDYCFTPAHYLFLLDKYYYLSDMFALKTFYQYQEKYGASVEVLLSYINVGDYYLEYYNLNDYQRYVFSEFLQGFNIDVYDFIENDRYRNFICDSDKRNRYICEVEDIIHDACKMKDFNELAGSCPHIV